VRRRLLNGIAGSNVLTGLLAATQAELPRRRQPIGQDREGLHPGSDLSSASGSAIKRITAGVKACH